MAQVIHAHDTKGPAEIKEKREYLLRHCMRFSTVHNIPFNPPKSLPFNNLYAARIACLECSGDQQREVIDLLFRIAWEWGLDLGEAEVIEKTLAEHGLPGAKWVDEASSKELRLALKVNTKKAIDKKLWGVPTFCLEKDGEEEVFWGNDSISDLMLSLDGKDPLDKSKYNTFLESFNGF